MSIRQIEFDIDICKKNYLSVANIKSLDTVVFSINIFENEVEKIITGQTIKLYCKRSNNTVVEQTDGITKSGNKITIKVKNSCFATSGKTVFELEMSDSSGVVTTLNFYMNVETRLNSEEVLMATNEISGLETVIERLNNTIEEVKKEAGDMVNEVQEVISNTLETSKNKFAEIDTFTELKKDEANEKVETIKILADLKLESLTNKVDSEIKKTDSKLESLQSRVESVTNKTDSDITSLNNKVETELNALDDKIKKGLEDISNNLEEGLMNTETELSTLGNKVTLMTNEASSLIETTKNNIKEATNLSEQTKQLNSSAENELSEINKKAENLLSEISNDYKTLQSAIVDENAVANIQSQVNSINKEISEKLKNDVRISTKIEKIKLEELSDELIEIIKNSGGGSGGGGGAVIGTITSTFNTTTATMGEEIIIPYFFSSPNVGRGVAHIEINGMEKATATASMGQNTINIGTLNKGRNSISLYVIDRAGVYTNILTFTVDCGTLEMTSTFDSEIDYNVSDEIRFPYEIDTVSTKTITVKFTINDKTYTTTAEKGYNIYTFPSIGVGVNKVKIQAFSGDYSSNVIEFNLVITSGDSLYVSSLYDTNSAQEGDTLVIDYRISMRGEKSFNVEYYIDGQLFKTLEAKLGTNYWSISTLEKGVRTLKIKVTTKDGTQTKELSFSITITESEYKMLTPVTSGLVAWFDASELSNNDENREIWEDKSGNGTIAKLHDFNFGTNGWMNNSLVCNGISYVEIDLAPFRDNCRLGTTIDIQFSTRDAGDMQARVLDCTSNTNAKLGAYIDTMNCHLTSLENKIEEMISENEKIRVTYVIDRDKKMAKVYINAVLIAVKFLSDRGVGNDKILEDFQHEEKIYLNSRKGVDNFGECEIYNLRIYNRALSNEEVLTNHIADIKDKAKQKKKYDFNFNDVMPTMYFYGDTEAMTKENAVTLRIKYIATEGYGTSFDLDNCVVNWQGTSSLQYAVKNYKIKLKNADGTKYKHALYDNWIEESTFTLKADYMESSHCNNTGLAKIVGKYLYDTPIPPQEEDERIRTTISGFPIKLYINNEVMGVFNFNLDKKDNDTFGLNTKKYPECVSYEVSANSNVTAGAFNKWTVGTGISEQEYYLNDFELRYPSVNEEKGIGEDYKMLTSLKRVVDWVSDASDEKFKTELEQYFNKEYLIKYYIHTMLFGMVDNFGKNMMLTTWDGQIWYPTFYDLDSSLGLDNTGYLRFDCDIEMASGYFNTSSSQLWVKLQKAFPQEIKEVYKKLRSTKYNYDNFMSVLINEQIDCIPETLYNLDSEQKYLKFGKEYLHMLHGNRKEHLKRWIKERILFLDTVWEYDVDTSSSVTIRANKQGDVYLNIQTYSPMYLKVVWRNNEEQVLKIGRDETVKFSSTLPTSTDQEVIIYGAKYLKDLGDLSNLNPSSMLLGNATRLSKLKCTSTSLLNAKIDGMTFLRELDLTGCTLLGTGVGAANVMDVSNIKSLRKLLLQGTAITSLITSSSGCNLEEIYFPDGIQVIDLRNMEGLKTAYVPYTNSTDSSATPVAKNLLNCTIINCPKLKNLGWGNSVAQLSTCESIYLENTLHEGIALTRYGGYSSLGNLINLTIKNCDITRLDLYCSNTALSSVKINECKKLVGINFNCVEEASDFTLDVSKNPVLVQLDIISHYGYSVNLKKLLLSPSVTKITRSWNYGSDKVVKIGASWCPEEVEHDENFEGIDLKQEFTSFFTNNNSNTPIHTSYIKELHLNQSCENIFKGAAELTHIDKLIVGDNCTSCAYMFSSASKLSAIKNLVLPDTVLDCSSIFNECSSLENLDWFTIPNKVEKCNSMFSSSGLKRLNGFTFPESVTEVRYVFFDCKNLTYVENLTISNAKTICGLFFGCTSLESVTNLTLGGAPTDCRDMFSDCTSLNSITGMSLPSTVTSASNMFGSRNYPCGKGELVIKSVNLSNISSTDTVFFLSNDVTSADIRFEGVIICDILENFKQKSVLTITSLISILNCLENRKGLTPKTLSLGSINIAKLNETQKAIALNKNWTLS